MDAVFLKVMNEALKNESFIFSYVKKEKTIKELFGEHCTVFSFVVVVVVVQKINNYNFIKSVFSTTKTDIVSVVLPILNISLFPTSAPPLTFQSAAANWLIFEAVLIKRAALPVLHSWRFAPMTVILF